MITSPNGQFVTARTYPKMLEIQPQIIGDKMTLSAPGMIDIEVSFPRLYATSPITASVWQQPVKAIDCGEEVAKWFSRFIHAEDTGFRLVFYPGKKPTRDCVGRKPDSKDLTNYDAVFIIYIRNTYSYSTKLYNICVLIILGIFT